MPSQSTLYAVVIILLVVIITLGGYVVWTFLSKPSSMPPLPSANPTSSPTSSSPTSFPTSPNNAFPTPSPPLASPTFFPASSNNVFPTASPDVSPTPQPTTLDQVRDAAMIYIAAKHPDTAPIMTALNWTVQNQTSDPWSETCIYNSSGWLTAITNVDIRSQIYVVSANYSGFVYVTWAGTFENGGFTETKYLTNIGERAQVLNQAQVRDTAMNYIKTVHPETEQFMTALTWSGERLDTPSQLVEEYDYFSGNVTENLGWGWAVTIIYPCVQNPVYRVTAAYVSQVTSVSWQGNFQNGVVTETSYAFNS